MKKVILILIGLVLCSSQILKAEELKFAYVDVNKVFDEYEKTKKFDKELSEEGKGKQDKRDALVYEVRRLRDEQALLSEEKKKDAQAGIEAKLKELDEFDQKAQQDLGEKRNVIMKEIFTDIDDELKRFGERKGYDIIFNERALLHKNAKHDQTSEVLKELNDAYKKKKK